MPSMLNQCWESPNPNPLGYKGSSVEGKRVMVHRAVYEALVGPIPQGLEIDHLCRNRACYNPRHLEPVSHLENVRRGAKVVANKNSCPKGHPYPESLRYTRNECRICHNDRERTRK